MSENKNSNSNLLCIIWMVLTVLISIVYAVQQSIYVPLFQLDGAYQTASGLYRIHNGYIPGKDFFPYLGLFLTWVLYPIFEVSGANIGASMFASHFMVFWGLSFTFFVFSYFSSKNNLSSSLIISMVCSFIIIILYDHLNIVLLERVTPGNSLRPLRAFVAPLSLTLIYICFKKIKNNYRQIFLASLICGATLLWSNDFGYPSAFMCGIVYLFCLKKQRKLNLLSFSLFGFCSVASFVILSMLMTWGHMQQMILYNIDIAKDQYWYFGSWAEEKHISNFYELFSKFLIPIVGFKLLLIPLILVLLLKTKDIKHLFQFALGVSLLLGAIISVYGGHIEYQYANAYNFWCYSVLAIYGFNGLTIWVSKFVKFDKKEICHTHKIIFVVIAGITTLLFSIANTNAQIQKAKNNSNYIYVKKIGGYLPVEWLDYLELHFNSDKTLAEDYWGLYSAYHSSFSSAPTDSIIHALGSKRRVFNEATRESDVIITISPNAAEKWMGWLLSANWELYSNVLKNYRITKNYVNTDLWTRDKPKHWVNQKCVASSDGYYLPGADAGYYDILIKYDVTNIKGRGLYLIKNNVNYAMEVHGHVAINMNDGVFRFPAAITGVDNESNKLSIKKIGSVNGIKLLSCSADKITSLYEGWFPFFKESKQIKPVNYSDENWNKGVGKLQPSFFYTDSPFIIVRVGDEISFANGESREVTSVVKSGEFVNVYVTGDILDGDEVGSPNKVLVNKKME